MQAGDMVTLCRQVIDLLRQMANARMDNNAVYELTQKCISAIDRDVVQVHL
jgi:superfamily II RNA helicase